MLHNLDSLEALMGQPCEIPLDLHPVPPISELPTDLAAPLVEFTIPESEAPGESFHIRIAN